MTHTTISAGTQTDFSPLKGAKLLNVSNHLSRWGLCANFDNGVGVVFLCGSPLADSVFSSKNYGKVATGDNDFGYPTLK